MINGILALIWSLLASTILSLRYHSYTDSEKGRRKLLKTNPHLWDVIDARRYTGRPVSHFQ